MMCPLPDVVPERPGRPPIPGRPGGQADPTPLSVSRSRRDEEFAPGCNETGSPRQTEVTGRPSVVARGAGPAVGPLTGAGLAPAEPDVARLVAARPADELAAVGRAGGAVAVHGVHVGASAGVPGAGVRRISRSVLLGAP